VSESLDLQHAVESLTQAVKELRAELVRKDVYEANERTRDQEVAGLRDDVVDLRTNVDKANERRAADRRLYLQGLVFPAAILLLQLYLAFQVGGPR